MDEPQPKAEIELNNVKHKPKYSLSVLIFAIVSSILITTTYISVAPPVLFPSGNLITIEFGMSAKDISHLLKQKNVIRSEFLLNSVLVLFNDPSTIKAGNYVFETPISVFDVAEYITSNKQTEEQVTLVFYEGASVKKIGKIAELKLSNFNSEIFSGLAISSEGRLFPDTYFVSDDFSEKDLFNLLRETFERKIESVNKELNDHYLLKDELIILASIVEREANTEESMRIVAGILFTRMDIGMALQVDAPFEYILDKSGTELTPSDLQIDSPYNTYLYRGLPPTPIGNPGLTSIKAVLNPIDSNYLYYITGSDGEFYYAETFEKHKANIARYLR